MTMPSNSGHGAPKSHRAKQSPPNSFRPGLASPTKSPSGSNFKTRHQNPAVLRSSAPGKQLTPINSGRSEYREADVRPKKSPDGFAGVSRQNREDDRHKNKARKNIQGSVVVL